MPGPHRASTVLGLLQQLHEELGLRAGNQHTWPHLQDQVPPGAAANEVLKRPLPLEIGAPDRLQRRPLALQNNLTLGLEP
jgi:hypothetical protein